MNKVTIPITEKQSIASRGDAYREYMKKVPAIIEKYGGRYLVRGGEILADDTSWHPKRVVILEFPTTEHMDSFRNSEEYKPIKVSISSMVTKQPDFNYWLHYSQLVFI